MLKPHTSEAFKASFASGLLMHDLSDTGLIGGLLSVYHYFTAINHLINTIQLTLLRHGGGVAVTDLNNLYVSVAEVYKGGHSGNCAVDGNRSKQIARRKEKAQRMGTCALGVGLGAAVFLWYVFGAALRA